MFTTWDLIASGLAVLVGVLGVLGLIAGVLGGDSLR